MNKFYIKSIIRDDGLRLDFDAEEVFLANENTLLVNPTPETTELEYTEISGGEVLGQRNPSVEQEINGIVLAKKTEFWVLFYKFRAFFQINHVFKIITIKKNGTLFSQQTAWLIDFQMPPQPNEDYARFSLKMKIGDLALREYAEDSAGNEIFANFAILPLISASSGGQVWDPVGQVWDSVGSVWAAGEGGVQSVSIASVAKIYPVWTIIGPSVNPSLQNNTTDTFAKYDGTVGSGQTLKVDFSTGEAYLDGALVSRNIHGQVSFTPGENLVGFNSDGGSTSSSKIEWNNILG